jgi:hypothetical protein
VGTGEQDALALVRSKLTDLIPGPRCCTLQVGSQQCEHAQIADNAARVPVCRFSVGVAVKIDQAANEIYKARTCCNLGVLQTTIHCRLVSSTQVQLCCDLLFAMLLFREQIWR